MRDEDPAGKPVIVDDAGVVQVQVVGEPGSPAELAEDVALVDETEDPEHLAEGMRAAWVTFAHEYVVDFRGPQAAARAGYPRRYAARDARRLMKIPEVHALIRALVARRARSCLFKSEALEAEAIKIVRQTRDSEDPKVLAVRLKALEFLAKLQGTPGALPSHVPGSAEGERERARERALKSLERMTRRTSE